MVRFLGYYEPVGDRFCHSGLNFGRTFSWTNVSAFVILGL